MAMNGGGTAAVAGRRHRRRPVMAEINVTPMVDVMLVLLIIFMVSAPLLTVGVPLENDQQDQHDVDHRRHVDLSHDRATAMPPAGDRGGAPAVHRHLRPPIPVRRSAAIESRQTRRRTPPGAGPVCSRRTRTCYRKWSPVWRR